MRRSSLFPARPGAAAVFFAVAAIAFAGAAIALDAPAVDAPSRREAELATPPPEATALRVGGFARPGDGGGARFRRLPTGVAPPPGAAGLRTADGAAWAIDEEEFTPQMFGARGDDSDASAGLNLRALREAMAHAGRSDRPLRIPEGVYRVGGGVYAVSRLRMRFDPGAWLKPTEYSVYGPPPAGAGAFLSNVTARRDHADSLVSDIVIDNPQIDGALLPTPFSARVVSSGADGWIRLAPIVEPVFAGGRRETLRAGRMISVVAGERGLQTARIAEVAADGLAVRVEPPFPRPLAVGDLLRAASNDNAIGFGVGARNVLVRGGLVRNFLATWAGGGSGGKAVNFEKGCANCVVDGLRAETVSWGVFAQGMAGRWPSPPDGNGASRGVTDIVFRNIVVSRCEAAAGFYGLDAENDPTGDPSVMSARLENLEAIDCGAAVTRPLLNFREKSGALVFAEAQNVVVRGFRLRNRPGYPENFGGAAGPIGAVVWGWGRNLSVEARAEAEVEAVARLARARAMGDDAAPRGQIRNAVGLSFDVALKGAAGTLLAIEPGAARGEARAPTANSLGLSSPPSRVDGLLVGRRIEAIVAGTRQSRLITAHDGRTGRIAVDAPWSPPLRAGDAYVVAGVERPPPDQLAGRLRLTATRLSGPLADTPLAAYPGLTLDAGAGPAPAPAAAAR